MAWARSVKVQVRGTIHGKAKEKIWPKSSGAPLFEMSWSEEWVHAWMIVDLGSVERDWNALLWLGFRSVNQHGCIRLIICRPSQTERLSHISSVFLLLIENYHSHLSPFSCKVLEILAHSPMSWLHNLAVGSYDSNNDKQPLQRMLRVLA